MRAMTWLGLKPTHTDLRYAHARGYYDGRRSGSPNNPYNGETAAEMHAAYKAGYDTGVADYCIFDLKEDWP